MYRLLTEDDMLFFLDTTPVQKALTLGTETEGHPLLDRDGKAECRRKRGRAMTASKAIVFALFSVGKARKAACSSQCIKIFVSARQKDNIDELKSLLYERVKDIHIQRFPYNDFLFQKYDVEE